MHARIYTAALSAIVATLAAAPAVADNTPAKQPMVNAASVRLAIQPGETVRWQSPRIGEVRSLYVRINGNAASYNVVAGTNRCVAYIYGSGVVARVTDCVKGRRVPYVRVRAVSAALKPAMVVLRLNGG